MSDLTYTIEPQPDEGPVRLQVTVEIHGDSELLAKCDQGALGLDRTYYVRRILLFLRSPIFKEDYETFVRTGRRSLP